MKAILVARKMLIEILREPQLLGLELGMPLIFLLLILGMYNTPIFSTYPIRVIGPAAARAALAAELQEQHYPNGQAVFNISADQDAQAAETALKDKSATAVLFVNADSSQVTLRGDAISATFYRASIFLDRAVRRYAGQLAGRAEIVRAAAQPLYTGNQRGAGPRTLADLYCPGMIVFAVLMLIPQTAMLVAREIRWKTLRRLRLSPLSTLELLMGVCLAQMAVAVFQVVLIFFAAQALGFHNQGSLWLAVLVGLVLSFSAIGLGLLVACFVENDSQAANLASTFSMLQVFLSGSWFALPPLTVFTLAGHAMDLFDIFPATSAFLALQQVLVYGAGLPEIGFRLGVVLFLSGVYFSIGVVVFNHTQMHR